MNLIYRTLLFLCLLLSGCSPAPGAEKPAPGPTDTRTAEVQQPDSALSKPAKLLQAEVIRAVDGDTLKVRLNGKEETVRLILVDTPETVKPDTAVQPFGPEASRFTKEQLNGTAIELEPGVQERDQYGRLLAYVWQGNTLYNAVLLEKGYARVAVFPPNTKYVDEFRRIQQTARQAKRGIWSLENYATDHGFHPEAAEAPPANTDGACRIKGNINSSGEKIYHLPGQQFYERTKAEQLFCSETEAKAAGYRKSLR